MSKEKTLIKNTLIISIGKICTQLITFFLLPVYTAYLSTEQFGVVDLLSTLVSFLLPIITLQLEQGAFRLLIDSRSDEQNTKKIITTTVMFVTLQSLIYIFVFLIFSRYINNDYKYFLLTNVIACIFSSIFLQITRGIGNNAKYAIGSFICALVTLVFNVILVVGFKLGAYGMLVGTFLGHVVCIIYIFISNRMIKYIDISKYSKEILKQMLKYSIPLIPNIISWWIVNVSDRTLVTYFLGIAQNGILSAANKFSNLFITLYAVFNMALTESVVLSIQAEDKNEFLSKTFDMVIRIFGCACIMLIAVMPIAFPLLINEKFSEAYNQIPILMVGTIFNILVSFIGSVYVAKKQTKEIAKTSIIAAIINVVINFSFINVIGLYAAAISTAIAYIAMFIYRWIDCKKYVNIKLNLSLILSLTVYFILATIVYYINNIKLTFIFATLTFIYCIFINKNNFRFVFNTVLKKIKK